MQGDSWLRVELRVHFLGLRRLMLSYAPRSEEQEAVLDQWEAALLVSGYEFEPGEGTALLIMEAFAALSASMSKWPAPVHFLNEYSRAQRAERERARNAAAATRPARAPRGRELAAPEIASVPREDAPAAPPVVPEDEQRRRVALARLRCLEAIERLRSGSIARMAMTAAARPEPESERREEESGGGNG